MQFATTIDGYIGLLVNGNSGDYANSWLIADIKTNDGLCFAIEYPLLFRFYPDLITFATGCTEKHSMLISFRFL